MSAYDQTGAGGTAASGRQFSSSLQVAALVALFVFVWTIYPTFTRFNLDQYGDMLENYAWGIGWQWGYFKHPPFFAWTTAAWFSIFPNVDWAYYLLSAINAGLTIVFSWRIATRFLDPWRAFIAAALFFFLPPVTFLATKFNANSALLPLWPLTVLFYLRLLENRRLVDAILLGLFAAIALLTKYFSAVLLLSIVLHVLVDREARQLLLRPTTWLAALVFMVAFAPHVLWLVHVEFLPVTYAASQGDGRVAEGIVSSLRFVGAIILYALPVGLILLVALRRNRIVNRESYFDPGALRQLTATVEGRALLWTTFGSIGVSLVAAIALGTRLSSVWALPMFYSLPILLLLPVRPGALEVRRNVMPIVVAIYSLGLLVAIPVVHFVQSGREAHSSHVPVQSFVAAIEEAWAQRTDQPLRYVAGDKMLSTGASFYGRSRPFAVIENQFQLTPWIDPQDVPHSGMALACLERTDGCEDLQGWFPVEFMEPLTISVPDELGRDWQMQLYLALPADEAS